MTRVHVSDHPLVAHHLAKLRDPAVGPAEFRRLVRRLTTLVGCAATGSLATREASVETPLAPARCRVLAHRIAIVPILRAGLGMAEGLLDLIPDAEVWHVGLARDEETLAPREYYRSVPSDRATTTAIVVDPMLATGGSALRACEILRAAGVGRIVVLALIAAPEGVKRLAEHMPDVPIHAAALDEGLDGSGFIVPGLGDAGDRQFGTLPA